MLRHVDRMETVAQRHEHAAVLRVLLGDKNPSTSR